MEYKNYYKCQISGSTDLKLILSLGLIPMVNQMSKIDEMETLDNDISNSSRQIGSK